MFKLPPEMVEFAEGQCGLVTMRQVLGYVSAHHAKQLVRAGVLLRTEDRGVLRLAGATSSFKQRACGLTLAHPGLVMSHLAAAHLLSVESVAEPLLEATAGRGRGPTNREAVIVHRRRLPDFDVTERWGIPVTAPARTILDLSTAVQGPLLKRIYDDLVRGDRMQPKQLEFRLGRGDLPRINPQMLEPILGRRVGASPREDWMVDTIVGAGLPCPERNVIVEVDGRLWELDCAYRAEMVAIEYQGRRAHADNSGLDRDSEKFAALTLAGWLLLPVTYAWSEAKLIARVRTALQKRGRLVSPG